MLASTSILVPAAGVAIAAVTGILIRTRRKREDKLRREGFTCFQVGGGSKSPYDGQRLKRRRSALPTAADTVQFGLVLREIQR